MVADLFFGCQLNTWFLLPTLCNGRERSAPEDASEEEEEEEEPEDRAYSRRSAVNAFPGAYSHRSAATAFVLV